MVEREGGGVAELGVLAVSGGQVELVEAGVRHRVDDVGVEREHEPRRQVRRSAHELHQVADALLRCTARKT